MLEMNNFAVQEESSTSIAVIRAGRQFLHQPDLMRTLATG